MFCVAFIALKDNEEIEITEGPGSHCTEIKHSRKNLCLCKETP